MTHQSILQDGIEREWLGTKPSGNTLRKVNLSYILAVAFEIASAMRYLHKHNILHGDLTAGNVLLASAPISTNDQRGFRAKASLPTPLFVCCSGSNCFSKNKLGEGCIL